MSTLNNKQKAINGAVKASSSVLGFIHAASTIAADLSLKAELNLHARFAANEDGSKLSVEDLINVAQNRILSTQEVEHKLGTKQRPVDLQDITLELS